MLLHHASVLVAELRSDHRQRDAFHDQPARIGVTQLVNCACGDIRRGARVGDPAVLFRAPPSAAVITDEDDLRGRAPGDSAAEELPSFIREYDVPRLGTLARYDLRQPVSSAAVTSARKSDGQAFALPRYQKDSARGRHPRTGRALPAAIHRRCRCDRWAWLSAALRIVNTRLAEDRRRRTTSGSSEFSGRAFGLSAPTLVLSRAGAATIRRGLRKYGTPADVMGESICETFGVP